MLACAENDDNDDAGHADVPTAVLSGFHRLVTVGRLAETKVPIYTQLLNACQHLRHTDDTLQMCIRLYEAYPSGRTADALIRRLNATTGSTTTTTTDMGTTIPIGIMDDGRSGSSAVLQQLLNNRAAQLAHVT